MRKTARISNDKFGGRYMVVRPSKKKCPICGGEMSQRAKTCWECRKRQVTKKCVICGKEFTSKKSKNQQTCSKECAYTLRGKKNSITQSRKVKIRCKNCGKERWVSPSYRTRKFCSLDCWYEYNSGENNPMWQGGISSERAMADTSREWKTCRKAVWKRDDATCQLCGERFSHDKQTYEVHHIRPFKYEDTRYDVDNLVLLCNRCHNWVHSSKNQHGLFRKN